MPPIKTKNKNISRVVLFQLRWKSMYDALFAFSDKVGNCSVPLDSRLAEWILLQRENKKRGILTKDQIMKLERLKGFTWGPKHERKCTFRSPKHNNQVIEIDDDNKTQDISKRKITSNTTNVATNIFSNRDLRPDSVKSGPQVLEIPVESINNDNNNSTQSKLKYEIDPTLLSWVQSYASQRRHEFQGNENNRQVPQHQRNVNSFRARPPPPPPPPIKTTTITREDRSQSELDEQKWCIMYEALIKYMSQHGTCNVSTHYPGNPELAHWCNFQRYKKQKQCLTKEQIRKLDNIGFKWSRSRENMSWENMFERLQMCKEKYGTLPQFSQQEEPYYNQWCLDQRRAFKEGTLSLDRLMKLRSIHFDFVEKPSMEWNDMYEKLTTYKEEYGNCLVPHHYPADTNLGLWVQNQRKQKAKGVLPIERVKLLNVIGFSWDGSQKSQVNPTGIWKNMFDRLVHFKLSMGHCEVPYKYEPDLKLGRWVIKQRDLGKKGKLLPERKRMLNQLGFVWNIWKAKREAAADPFWKEMEPKAITTPKSFSKPEWRQNQITPDMKEKELMQTEEIQNKTHKSNQETNKVASDDEQQRSKVSEVSMQKAKACSREQKTDQVARDSQHQVGQVIITEKKDNDDETMKDETVDITTIVNNVKDWEKQKSGVNNEGQRNAEGEESNKARSTLPTAREEEDKRRPSSSQLTPTLLSDDESEILNEKQTLDKFEVANMILKLTRTVGTENK